MSKNVDKYLEIKILDKSAPLLPVLFISFYKLISLIVSQCLPKSKFPACANVIQYAKKYQKNFWTKETWIVTFITTFWTFHNLTTELFGLAKYATKSLLHSKSFIVAIQSYCSDLFSKKKSAFQKKIEFLLDSLSEFLEAFDQGNKVSQIQLHKPKFEIGFTKAKDELFSHCYNDIVEHSNRQIRLSFRFEKKQDLRLFHQNV